MIHWWLHYYQLIISIVNNDFIIRKETQVFNIQTIKRPNQEFFADLNRTCNFCLPNQSELLCIWFSPVMKWIELWRLVMTYEFTKKIVHRYCHRWFVRTLRTFKTEHTLHTKKIKNALFIPEIKYKVTDIRNTHTV